MVLALDEARPLLTPFFERLSYCVTSAIAHYNGLPAEERVYHKKRTRANIINDQMVRYAREAFADDPNVRFIERNSHTRLVIADRFEVRLKKLDEHLRSRNVPTQQAMAFLYQLQPVLPGFEPLTNIIVGYRWNLLQTEITGVYIVCPLGDNNEWVIEIATQPQPVSVPDFLGKSQPDAEKPTRRVVAKKDASADAATDAR